MTLPEAAPRPLTRAAVPRPVRAVLAALIVAAPGFAGVTMLAPDDGAWSRLADGVYLAMLLGSALLVGLAGRHRREAGWWCLAGALTLWTIGDLIWSAQSAEGSPPPTPGPADLCWLAFYVCAYTGFVLLLRSSSPSMTKGVVLDGLIVGCGGAGVAALAFGLLTDTAGAGSLEILTNLAYPVADVLLLALVVGGLAMLGWRRRPALCVLALSCAMFAVTDTAYLLAASAGDYAAGGLLDAGWPTAAVVMAVAAWLPRGDPHAQIQETARVFLPTVAVLAALALLVVDHFHRVPTLTLGFATLTVLAVVVRAVLAFREVIALGADRRQALGELERQAVTDELTGLLNRRGLYRALEQTLDEAPNATTALLVLDLDRFKEINDGLGHHVGDLVLHQLGPRLTSVLEEGQLLARLGGDEFALLLPLADESTAVATARRVEEAVCRPVVVDQLSLYVGVSIGIAVSRPGEADRAALLRQADVAMYEAKRAGGGSRLYVAHDGEHDRSRLETIQQLRAGLENGELICHYQPKCDLRSGTVTGAEALVRWEHPDRGLLGPAEFLPLAEASGLMGRLSHRVLRTALAQAATWREAGTPLDIAVNLSATNLLEEALPALVGELLREYGVDPARLTLEITEDVLMVDPARALGVVVALRDLGVGIAVDDYGTGYSSLAYLRNLPVTELKLDRTFVVDVAHDSRHEAIVRTTVDLAHSLGLALVAEGVETSAVWERLRHLGADVAQGYFLSPPLPADELERWLARGAAPLAQRSAAASAVGG